MDAEERKIETIAYKVIGNAHSGANKFGSNAVGCMQDLFGNRAEQHSFGRLLHKFTGDQLDKYFPHYEAGYEVNAAPNSAGIFVLDNLVSARNFISSYNFYDVTDVVKVICYGNKSTNINSKFIYGCFNIYNLHYTKEPHIGDFNPNMSYAVSAYQLVYVDHIIPKGEYK